MPITLIKGFYRILDTSPDGDSVRFYPRDPNVWAASGIAVRTNPAGGVQLRLDAIDALETHYTPPQASASWRQPAGLGDGAGAALLDLLGFSGVARDERGYVTSATPAQTPGYILTRFADMYGRAVATALAGGRRGRGPSTAARCIWMSRSCAVRSTTGCWRLDGCTRPSTPSSTWTCARSCLRPR